MNRAVATCLQLGIVSLGFVILAALLWEPWVEGVNANATSIRDIYFDDPFLMYIYASFIPVFFALYKAFKLLDYIGRGEGYSQQSALALRAIKYCTLSFAAFILAAVAFIVIVNRGEDDIAGGVAMGLFMIIVSGIVATVAGMAERKVSRCA